MAEKVEAEETVGGGGKQEKMEEEEEERVRGRQKGEEGRQRARKRAIDSNVGDILRRRDRERWERERERQRERKRQDGVYVCARVTQRGMTKEGDKARE